MSATNTTTNYNLPIFIGTDKPAWLVDFNGAMNAIDAQMKTNADAIATKSPILTFSDTTNIDFTVTSNVVTADLSTAAAGTLSRALLTPAVAPISDQIPYVDTSNTQQMLQIGTGLEISSGSLNAIDLNLSSITNFTSTAQFRTISGSYSSMTVSLTTALNSSGTVGKCYGYIQGLASTAGTVSLYTGKYVSNASATAYDIAPAGFNNGMAMCTVHIEANGEIVFQYYQNSGGNTTTAYFLPCVYFFEDFGDVPI